MKKIQNIFIINMKHRTDIWDYLQETRDFFEQKGIKVTRIEGYNLNYELQQNSLLFNQLIIDNKISLGGLGFHKTQKSMFGEFGAFLAHTKCWNKIVDEGLEGTLIIEDGVIFHPSNFNDEYHPDIDLTYVNKEMKIINNTIKGFGLQGYILSNTGAKKIQKEMMCLYMPVDIQIRELCKRGVLTCHIRSKYMFSRNNLPQFDKGRTSSMCDSSKPINDDHQNIDSIGIRIIKGLIDSKEPLQNYLFAPNFNYY